MQIIECVQNSPEWFQARLGLPTASCFSQVLAKGEGKTRMSYMRKLAAEIITGDPGENFTTPAMERGKVMEDEARNFYAFMEGVEPQRVGFIRNGIAGCSPDSLIGPTGMLEIKTQRGDLLIETITADKFPAEHVAQCQGNLWIAEREWIDANVYWPGMPRFCKRAYRDEKYIANLASEVTRFNDELQALVERIRNYGQRAEAA